LWVGEMTVEGCERACMCTYKRFCEHFFECMYVVAHQGQMSTNHTLTHPLMYVHISIALTTHTRTQPPTRTPSLHTFSLSHPLTQHLYTNYTATHQLVYNKFPPPQVHNSVRVEPDARGTLRQHV